MLLCLCIRIEFWEQSEWLENLASYLLYVYGVEVAGGYLQTLLYD